MRTYSVNILRDHKLDEHASRPHSETTHSETLLPQTFDTISPTFHSSSPRNNTMAVHAAVSFKPFSLRTSQLLDLAVRKLQTTVCSLIQTGICGQVTCHMRLSQYVTLQYASVQLQFSTVVQLALACLCSPAIRSES